MQNQTNKNHARNFHVKLNPNEVNLLKYVLVKKHEESIKIGLTIGVKF